ncbi:MAG: phage holin family protein [Paludibacteraceae bacterium]|nr:phage holin family protein [Paludibacteraceae bacterium]
MFNTISGLLITMALGIFNFFAGYKVALGVVLAAIIFDGIWGVAAARKTGKFILSELGKDTLKKIGAYGTALVMVILIENLAFGSHQIISDEGANTRFIVDIVATLIAAVEFWSICGNILIIYPNAIFFRLLKPTLIGEIARKMKLSEEKAKEMFEEEQKS